MKALLFLALSAVPAAAGQIYVPDDHPTIQGAIAAAVPGDEVVVRSGTYVENVDFLGKDIVVRSEHGPAVTTIDGSSPANPSRGSVVVFENGESLNAKLDGFTLRGGTGTLDGTTRYGGGIVCRAGAKPQIVGNVIRDNAADQGGGIAVRGTSAPLIGFNAILDNASTGDGGGIFCPVGAPQIVHNEIAGNSGSSGAGIAMTNGSAALIQGNQIAGNQAQYYAGGILSVGSSPTIVENEIWSNHAWYDGGGLRIVGGTVPIERNVIAWNAAEYAGGGLHVQDDALADLRDNVITRNRAAYDGGGFKYTGYTGAVKPELVNNLVVWNESNYGGDGGTLTGGFDGTLRNDTIAFNQGSGWGLQIGDNSGWPFSGGVATPLIESCIVHGHKGYDVITFTGGTVASIFNTVFTTWKTIDASQITGAGHLAVDPLFVQGPEGFFYVSQVAAGDAADSPCLDAGVGLAAALGLDLAWTRRDEVADAGTVDIGFHYSAAAQPSLQVGSPELPLAGGTIDFAMVGPASLAGRGYLLLAGVSGSTPGTPGPEGLVTVPLNLDAISVFVLNHLGSPAFTGFFGVLDAQGRATASWNTFGALSPTLLGLKLDFAWATYLPTDFASLPASVTIVP